MAPRSLRIFKKKKGIYLYPDQCFGILLTVGIFAMIYMEKSHGADFNGWVVNLTIIWFLYGAGLMLSTFFRYEKEFGEYTGKLTLWEDKIQVNEREIPLSEITKLDFQQAWDIKGTFTNTTLEFSPNLSNGLNNFFILELKNGEKIKDHFLQTKTDRLKHFEEVLIHYQITGILGWLQLVDLLEIEDYGKIQELKIKVNNCKHVGVE